ncbi:hypothetical protein Pcinc_023442 [Petrolisthes cinctipes]|uniref:Uncharacterized protein n=1 Tax=Petrolisthes cinctipes TaxID=88211 RepID=A0AAE1FCC0_PETCI|nr:hypothetical protein Pcinc_023442 [Petrolisthes cinctipes]
MNRRKEEVDREEKREKEQTIKQNEEEERKDEEREGLHGKTANGDLSYCQRSDSNANQQEEWKEEEEGVCRRKKRREGKRRTVYDSCWLESEVIRHNKGATPSIPSFSPHKLAQDDLP